MPKSGKGDKPKKNRNNNDKPYTRPAQDSSAYSKKIVEEQSDEPPFATSQSESPRKIQAMNRVRLSWYHRKCVGISKRAYDIASESDNPF